jgi:hypothetical protein
MFVMIRGFNKYQDATGTGNSENTWEEDYNEEYGWGVWNQDLENFRNSLEDWGEFTETLELVPSLTTSTMN